jgi:hypothetical protein
VSVEAPDRRSVYWSQSPCCFVSRARGRRKAASAFLKELPELRHAVATWSAGEGIGEMGYDAEIRQPLDRGDWEQREVYAHFGLAIYFCQVVEVALVNYLLLLRRATAAAEISEIEIDELFAELFGNTLGRNISNVKRILGEHGEWVLADQMTETLIRNELVHHWMRTRSLLQGTSGSRLAMIEELESATAKLRDASHMLSERTQALLAKAGLPDGFIEDEHQRLKHSLSVARMTPRRPSTSRGAESEGGPRQPLSARRSARHAHPMVRPPEKTRAAPAVEYPQPDIIRTA